MVWYARALLWGLQTLVFLCCENRAFVCYGSVCSFGNWKGVQTVHVIHAHVYCCLRITMYKWALEESLLADVVMALPIYKYEPWHLYFPYPGLSLARCSEDWLFGAFKYDSLWHIVYCTQKKNNCLSDSYQADKKGKRNGYPLINGILLNLKCTLTGLCKALLSHSAEK